MSSTEELNTAETATQLRVAITRLWRALRTSSPGGLTQSQWACMVTIEVHQPVRLGDVAEHEGVSAPTATRLVASLETLGLVSREVDQSDRRSSYVSLTPEGASKLDWARKVRTAKLSRRLAGLPQEDIDRLRDCLPILERLAGEEPGAS